MYTLYWSKFTGAFAPHAALSEADVPHDLVEVDLESGEHRRAEFLALNPRAQVPVLVLPNGAVMTESAAMVMHIADCNPHSGLMPDIGSPDRARVYRWLVFAAVNLYEAVCRSGEPFYYTNREEGYQGVKEQALADMDRYWEMVHHELVAGPYLLDHRYSVADLYFTMILEWHTDQEKLFSSYPKLGSLYHAVRERPAIERIWQRNFG